MAKKKDNRDQILAYFDKLNKDKSEIAVFSLGNTEGNFKVKRWSTGIEDLDIALGGGIPEGRIIEIFGPESSGKTTLAYWLCAQHEQAIYHPAEGTFDEDRAYVFGNKKGQLIVTSAKYGEEYMAMIANLAKLGTPIQIVDSVPSLRPKSAVEKIEKMMASHKKEEIAISPVAVMFNNWLPTIADYCESTGSTLIFINQTRVKVGGMAFGDNTSTPGGNALKFNASIRMKIARRKWITIPNKNPYTTETEEKIGMVIKIRVEKNKVSPPYKECEIPLIFDTGFVSFDQVDEIRKERMANNRKRTKEAVQETNEDGWD